MANQDFGSFNRAGTIADQAAFDVGLRAHMVRVYNYMSSGLALSGIVAFAVFNFGEVASLFFQVERGVVVGMNTLGWVAIFAPLGLLLLVSFRAQSMSVVRCKPSTGRSRPDGRQPVAAAVPLHRRVGGPYLLRHGRRLRCASLYGYTTKRDLTAMGKFLFMGLNGLILAGLVNMIWPSGTMSFIISAAGVLIFSGLIAYDTQKIKEQYAGAWGTDTAEKVAIFGALSLYLDFVNLFQFLMMFLGQRR